MPEEEMGADCVHSAERGVSHETFVVDPVASMAVQEVELLAEEVQYRPLGLLFR